MIELLNEDWRELLKEELEKEYFVDLMNFLESEYVNATIYPPKNQIFSAFNYTSFDNVKVVILGQDPYHGFGQANGLAFSVSDDIILPPSLRNIFKELKNDLGTEIPKSGNLEKWAKQGVLLLNDVLTVRESKAGSHQKKGWEKFTSAVIELISNKKENVVFLLWGNYAQKKGKNINNNIHLILKSGHPSPMSANQGKWFGNQHFSKANNYLKNNYLKEINW